MASRFKSSMAWRAVLLGVLAVAMFAVPAQAVDAWHYSGEATGVQVSAFTGTLAAFDLTLVEAGPLEDRDGASDSEQLADVNQRLPAFTLQASLIKAETFARGDTAHSGATILGLQLGLINALNLSSTTLQGIATATCGNDGPELSGRSVIEDLVVNGTPVTATGAPNQTVDLGPVQLVINEQTRTFSPDGQYGEITVTALRITFTDPFGHISEIVLSQAQADVRCPPNAGNGGPPGGDIGGPCADPAYYGIFDNSDSTVANVFRFQWYNRNGLNTVKKTVPAGAIFRTWEHWVKPFTTIRVAYKDPTTGNWVLLASEQSVKGTYPPCHYQRGFDYHPAP